MITSVQCDRRLPLGDPMAKAGWSIAAADPLEFSLPTADGTIVLRGHLRTAGWMQFLATGDGVPAVAPAAVLRANANLAGPAKYVARSGMVSLRFDVPLDILAADDPPDFTFGGRTLLETWAEDITAVLAPHDFKRADFVPVPAESIVQALEARQWVAAVDDDGQRVRVTQAVPGLFRHIFIASDRHGTRVGTALIDLADWSDRCKAAAIAVAQTANDRLHLARFAFAPGSSLLVAEVSLGAATVPGVWLDAALEAIGAAVATCGRELLALGDERLAHLVLEQCSSRSSRVLSKGGA